MLNALRLYVSMFLTRINWYDEVVRAYSIEDWKTFLFCFRQQPDLIRRPIMGRDPLFISFESEDEKIVKAMLAQGANPDATTTYYESDKFLTRTADKLRGYFGIPYYDSIVPMTALIYAHEMNFQELFLKLKKKASPETHALTLWAAVMRGNEKLAREFDLRLRPDFAGLFLNAVPFPIACLLGNGSRDLFEDIWTSSQDVENKARYTHIDGGHFDNDHDPIYEGDALYWAGLLGRNDIAEFLRQEAGTIL